MTTPQAQTKLNEVYDFMMSFEGMINPNNIRFSRWLRDAKALRKSNPALGFLMEALVYRAQGNLDQAVDYAEKAYRLERAVAGDDYATLLSNAGLFEEAVKLVLMNLQEDNFNNHAINRLIIDSSITIDKNALSQGLSLFKDPNHNYKDLLSPGYSNLDNFAEKMWALEQANITLDTFLAVSSIATRALNSCYLGNSEVNVDIQRNEVGTFFIIDHKVAKIDIDDCFMIHDKYTDDLIDSELSFKDYKRIVYNFLPLEDEGLSNDNIAKQQGISV